MPYLHSPKDLIIIGGGINGAAIARDAAMRGLKVLLLEKNDFGFGASTKTSKLAHGGIRYLEHGHFGLVRESLIERELLLKNAPHLVHPLSFVLPVFKGDPYPLWQLNLGLYLYDFLKKGSLPRHRKLNKEEILTYFPDLNRNALTGGCFYFDAQMQDNRLVLENILDAEKNGATIFNYSPLTNFVEHHGKIEGVLFSTAGIVNQVKGRIVVNATGAWSDQIAKLKGNHEHNYVKPSKGVHLIIPQINSQAALLLRAPQDGRVFFVIPWKGFSLVGTTDTFYSGSPEKIQVTTEDRQYLLEAINCYFPHLSIDTSKIIAEFAGLRPLAIADEKSISWKVSRDHSIMTSENGLISVLGGKFTTHRKIAEEVVDQVVERLGMKDLKKCMTAKTPLPGASGEISLDDTHGKLKAVGLSLEHIDHLIGNYGTLSLSIHEIILKDPNEGKQICSDHPHLLAEISYAIRHEHAKKLSDWFCRRTSIAYTTCRGLKCLHVVANKFSELLGWSEQQREAAIKEYQFLG